MGKIHRVKAPTKAPKRPTKTPKRPVGGKKHAGTQIVKT